MKIIKEMLLYGIWLILVAGIWFVFGNSIRESQGFMIAVVAGSPFEIKAHRFGNISEIKLDNDDSQTFNELASGKVDGIFTDRLVGLNVIKKANYQNLRLAGDLFDQEATAVAFTPKDKALREAVNRALAAIVDDGTYARISRKYFGQNILKEFNRVFTSPNESIPTEDSWKRIQQIGRIRFAIHCESAPFSNFDEYNHLTGFDIEIARAICRNLGVEFIPMITSWETVAEGLRVKRYDGILGIATGTFALLDYEFEFSAPLYYSGTQLFVRDDSPITGPEILQKERFPGLFSLPKLVSKLPNILDH